MKKALAVILALAVVFSFSVTAFAAGPQAGTDSMNQQMPGNFQRGQADGGRPGMGGQPPMMNGQAPDDLPELPEMDGEAPDDLPELPEMDGSAPEMGSRPPEMNGRAPGFINFEDMAADGVISDETLENIMAYMDENKPADLPENDGEAPRQGGQPPMMNGEAPDDLPEPPEMDGEAPDDLPEPPEMNGEAPEFDGEDSAVNGLLNDLLEAGVITQEEYDALCEALSK